MYQLEIKHWLVAYRFLPSNGWKVWVDVDAMERGKGGQNKPEKAPCANVAEMALREFGVTIGAHPEFGRVDIVAEHPRDGLFIVEVEGESSRQKDQAIYSALGQLMLQMRGRKCEFVLAVPDKPLWEKQLQKIPTHAKTILGLSCVLVSKNGAREV